MKKTLSIIIFSLLFSGCTTPPLDTNSPAISPSASAVSQAPLPSGKDVINLFWQLINEDKIPEAVGMMSPEMVPDDSTKQAYGVMFNSFLSVRVISVKAFGETEWTDKQQTYEVNLATDVNPAAANAPIPYYGYEGAENVRFIHLSKSKTGVWQIAEIATGP
jgi:hypothetical protein